MIIDDLYNKKPITESQLNEVDPRNFDSDEDYYAAVRRSKRGSDDDYDYDPDDEIDDMDDDESYYEKSLRSRGLGETRVGNRMSDMQVGSPKIVHKNGRAVGEIGLDHDPSPGQGPYYMKHYDTNTWYSGYDTKKEALADLKHVVDQMNEGVSESQLDEISLDQIGRGVGGVLGGIGKTVGAVAGVPQGIGRAIKKGYRGSVQGIGGNADSGYNPATDVPGAAYGGREVPTATGMINPATGRAYVPSDFGGEQQGARTAADVQQDIKALDTQYKTQMRKLQGELSTAQSQPAGDLSQAQKDYIAAIGTDEPQAGAPASTGAAPTATDPQQLLKSIQTLDQTQLALVKKMLQAQARQTANESTDQLDEVDWKGIQKKAAQWQKGAQKFTKNVSQTGQALGGAASAMGGAAKEVGKQFIAKPVAATYNATKSGLGKAANVAKGVYGDVAQGVKNVGQAGAQVGRDVGKVAGYTAGGVGAVAGGATTGVANAAKQGFATGAQTVGGMNMNNIQLAISTLTPQQAKQALAVVNQLMKKPAGKKKAAAKTTTAAPAWTGRPTTATTPAPAVAESLTWSKNWDPSASLLRKLH